MAVVLYVWIVYLLSYSYYSIHIFIILSSLFTYHNYMYLLERFHIVVTTTTMIGQSMQMAGATTVYPMAGKNSVMTLQSFAPAGSPYTGMPTGMSAGMPTGMGGSQMCMMPAYNSGMYSMPNMSNMMNMQACSGEYSYSSPSTTMYWGGMPYYPMYSQPMQNGMNTFVPCSTMPEESGN